MKINLNQSIKIKLTDKGIHHLVDTLNEGMPPSFRTCYRLIKSDLSDDNKMKTQMYDFINNFGGLGLRLSEYVDVNIELLEPIIKIS